MAVGNENYVEPIRSRIWGEYGARMWVESVSCKGDCISYNASRLKETISPCGRRNGLPNRIAVQFGDFFIVAKDPLDYLLFFESGLSSYLLMRWQD